MSETDSSPLKRVLIITYYWPPAGGAGVQRWLKFAKYLPEFGWQPVVYTPENPEYPSVDESLLSDVPEVCEVLRTPITEPYDLYRKLVGLKPTEKIQTGFLSESEKPKKGEAFARWIRGNFFIPDARMLWIKPSVRFLTNYLKNHPVDLIVSTGPPHSMHLIGLKLKARFNTRWVADFRDPWTNIDFYDELRLTSLADRKHHRLEREVLEKSDAVMVVGPTMKTEFAQITDSEKIHVVPNGFDREDNFRVSASPDPEFSIAHIGSFSPARNPHALWQALAELKIEQHPAGRTRIKTVGKVDITVRQSIEQAGLIENFTHIPYLPHDRVMVEQKKSSALLLVVNNTKNAVGILTGKVFEYLASGRPIVAIGPLDGDLASLLSETKGGVVFDYKDVQGLKAHLKELVAAHPIVEVTRDITRYERRVICEKIVDSIFNEK